jgi:uncharacterized membrane protein YkvI
MLKQPNAPTPSRHAIGDQRPDSTEFRLKVSGRFQAKVFEPFFTVFVFGGIFASFADYLLQFYIVGKASVLGANSACAPA